MYNFYVQPNNNENQHEQQQTEQTVSGKTEFNVNARRKNNF